MRKLLLILVFTLFGVLQPGPQVQARRYVDNGNKFYEKGKFKNSIMYRRALKGSAIWRGILPPGVSRYAAGRLWRRRARFRRSVELQPDNMDAR
jgi:hypothetical protein